MDPPTFSVHNTVTDLDWLTDVLVRNPRHFVRVATDILANVSLSTMTHFGQSVFHTKHKTNLSWRVGSLSHAKFPQSDKREHATR